MHSSQHQIKTQVTQSGLSSSTAPGSFNNIIKYLHQPWAVSVGNTAGPGVKE